MSDDVLSWLLPEADAVERGRVRGLVTALRLLRDDARRLDARRVAPSWRRARNEFERLERGERRRAIESLLVAHLAVLRPSDSFLELAPEPLAYDDAWRALLLARVPGFPPPPGASAQAVIARLLEAGGTLGAHAAWRELGEANLRHVSGPPSEALRNWVARLEARAASGAGPTQLGCLLAGALAARLDLGDPARAVELAARHARLFEGQAVLRRLLGWSVLLRGDTARARELLRGTPAARLPAALAELRADEPAWAEFLPGAADEPSAVAALPLALAPARRAFGALALGIFVARGPGCAKVRLLDIAPGMESVARSPAPVFSAAGVLRQRRLESSAAALAGALGGARTRARMYVALRDAGDTLRGWVQLECEHLLLPATARVQAFARACAPALLAGARVELGPEPGAGHEFRLLARADPRREFVARVFAELGPLRDGRACWLEPGPDGRWLVRAAAGRGLQHARGRLGGGGILRRVAAGLGAEHAGEPAEALHAAAAFGCALPLCATYGARLLGVLVLEFVHPDAAASTPREALHARLRALEPLWWACAFRARCLELGGDDLAWDSGCRFLARLAPALASALAARRPLLVFGPPGSGRRTLARWLRFRRDGEHAAGAETELRELAQLDSAAQTTLARALEAGGTRLAFLLAEASLHELRSSERLAPALAGQLEPLALRVPPLSERRDEIPALVRVFAGASARAADCAPLAFEDESLAELWRQPWPGQLPELAALVQQLALAHAGPSVSAAEVRAALAARGLSVCRRLPSRRPNALDLELALATTRHQNGSWNRARAARYLGWDAATLEARLRETS
ncbi:MAG: hypothetical protein EXS08_00130 [Planctomycetes bacterium]|nr:hypothetical protein [Planctomycetota bacterium]